MEYLKQDITKVYRGVIAHGVNCQGKMGSGVAKALRTKYPAIYETYSRVKPGADLLGMVQIVTIERETLFIANCYTQVNYGSDGRKYASPDAIRETLDRVYHMASLHDVPVYLPKIGAGLGGLDWETEVVPVIEELECKWPEIETYICIWE